MGILSKAIKHFEPTPEQKQLKQEEKKAYMESYRKGKIERAKREGYRKGRGQGGTGLSVDSIFSGLERVSRGAEHGLNLAFSDSPFSEPRRAKPKASSRRREIVIRVEGAGKHRKKRQAPRSPSLLEL